MSLDDLRPHPWDASLPPSLLGGGGAVSVWGTTAGDISSTFATVTGVDPGTIADRPTLAADPTVGTAAMTAAYDHDEFPAGAYIMLGDGDWVSWGGASAGWVDGPTPPPPPAPPPPPIDPSTMTVAAVIAWVEDTYGDHEGTTPAQRAEIQAILDAERAGQNRVSLVSWLDQLEGIV